MMEATVTKSRAAWKPADLEQDQSWIYRLDQRARDHLMRTLQRLPMAGKDLLDYRREDFDLGAAKPIIDAAFEEAKTGRGIALLKGLPRDGVSEEQFRLLTWGIGLHYGVGRPQGKATQYISAVRDAGVDYRSSTGRGYSSNAELDYHTDSADVIGLSCYNKAASGGMSMVVSSLNAYARMKALYPDEVHYLHRPVHFSRQGEFRPGEAASYAQPLFDTVDGYTTVRWNRNRVRSAQELPGVPRISPEHWSALEHFDALLRQPEVQFTMFLEPGDMQILNSHLTLHARTDYVDHEEPQRKRLLFRLWIAPPDSVPLPESWKGGYRSVAPGSVRGGILGEHYDDACVAFDRRQAAVFGMNYDEAAHR